MIETESYPSEYSSEVDTENLTNRSHYRIHLSCPLEGVEIFPNQPTTMEFPKDPNFDTTPSNFNAGTRT